MNCPPAEIAAVDRHTVDSREFEIVQPFPDLAGWVGFFRTAEIPVHGSTADAIEALRDREDEVDARSLSDVISEDPLMTLKLLIHSGITRPETATAQAETVTAALVMMGVGPFFRAFGRQCAVEDWFDSRPTALAGLQSVMRRAHRAARFALAFAVTLRDHDAAVIYEAALLHDLAEMLLWCHAPGIASDMRARQASDATLRSRKVQLDCLNVELADVQQQLMFDWRLPELLTRISDDRHADHPSVRCVAYAVSLARHTASGWENAAIADDIASVAALLHLSPSAVSSLLLDLDG